MTKKNSLSDDFIAAQRQRLQGLRQELQGADAQAAREVADSQETRSAEANEYEDGAQALDRKEILQARHDVDEQRLAHVERALQKIELGTYGLSDVSGKAIPRERLEATPEAVMTVDEAAARE